MIYFVYLLASKRHGTLYCGVTNDLVRRVYEHKSGQVRGFTSKYFVHRLVWYEGYEDIRDAILREKRIKRWKRDWKCRMIEETNPEWDDLFASIGGVPPQELLKSTSDSTPSVNRIHISATGVLQIRNSFPNT